MHELEQLQDKLGALAKRFQVLKIENQRLQDTITQHEKKIAEHKNQIAQLKQALANKAPDISNAISDEQQRADLKNYLEQLISLIDQNINNLKY